jgi:hypothetical protein
LDGDVTRLLRGIGAFGKILFLPSIEAAPLARKNRWKIREKRLTPMRDCTTLKVSQKPSRRGYQCGANAVPCEGEVQGQVGDAGCLGETSPSHFIPP